MKKSELKYNFAAKVGAYILFLITVITLASSIFSIIYMESKGFYYYSKENTKYYYLKEKSQSDSNRIVNVYAYDPGRDVNTLYNDTNLQFELYKNNKKVFSSLKDKKNTYTFENKFDYTKDSGKKEQIYTVKTYIDKKFKKKDMYYYINSLVDFGYKVRYAIFGYIIFSALLAIVLFVFLLSSAGYKKGLKEVSPDGVFTKMPFDVLTVIYATILLFTYDIGDLWYADEGTFALFCISITILVVFFPAYCMNFAKRVKLGKWWKNTLIYIILKYIYKGCKLFWNWLKTFFRNIKLVWKTIIFMIFVGFINFLFMIGCADCQYPGEFVMFLAFMFFLCITAFVIYLSLVLQKLQKSADKLSNGDLSYKVSTKQMFWDFKKHGDNLNNIALGMSKAVDKQLKSERMKTELLTNVSHDIKTPLTSIVNYADLISKEETDNEKILEYSEVLLRQSERLKKLIENLVQASKASTGNLEVNLAPCELDVLIAQTVGEFEQRLADRDLTLHTKKPNEPITIMADGRLLWRVFDNLMNNITKYSQSGTRVYLNVEQLGDQVVIVFKNISSEPLNISEEELIERFVRGDSSRNTEGNGLGLNISKSLTELQNGSFKLKVDGDLFKVTLLFNKI